ncbi:MAG: MFS transporter [Chloroflexi bacterium]|nr:MFS transporter [Chloroflexota bacterium]
MSEPGRWLLRAGFPPSLSRDGKLVYIACGLRNVAYGFLSVIIGLYLAQKGLSKAEVGIVFMAALAGGSAMTVLFTWTADRIGRKWVLVLAAIMMALAGAAFAMTESLPLLLVAAATGTVSPTGKELGLFLPIEESMLPQTTDDRHRTATFAWYNIVSSLAGATGALVAGLPALLGMSPVAGYSTLVWAYSGSGVLLLLLFTRLSASVGAPGTAVRIRFGLSKSMGKVARLASLFAIDSFGGGFALQGILAYWFYLRYGVDAATLGAVFFGANVLSALSFLLAVPIARRIGLLNTMVFTHLPSNILLMLVPLMPGFGAAVAVFMARSCLSQLDVPTRQSYSMAIVRPEERPAAAGIMAVARNAPPAVSAAFTGPTLAFPVLGLPFLIAGGLKLVYDVAVWRAFRQVKPPEET